MLTAALLSAAACVVVVALALCRAAARNDTFDEHTATALALLQPDNPDLPDDTQLADEIERWLSSRTPTIRPAAPDMEDPK